MATTSDAKSKSDRVIVRGLQDYVDNAESAAKVAVLLYGAFKVLSTFRNTRTPTGIEVIENVGKLAGLAGGAIACVSALVCKWRESSQCRITLDNPDTCHAVLDFMAVAKPPPAWVQVQEISLGKGRRSVLVPLGGPVNVPGVPSVSVSMAELVVSNAISYTADKGFAHNTSRDLKLYVYAPSVAVANSFVSKALAAYTAYTAEIGKARKAPVHWVYKGGELYDKSSMPPQSFDTLFYPEAQNIKEMVRTFHDTRDSDAELGLTHQRSLMLKGEPGCGKSSTAPAIAKKLGRSMVTVPLSFVSSFKDLSDLLQFIHNEIASLEDAVIVFEDCDTWEPFRRSKRNFSKQNENACFSDDASSMDTPLPKAKHSKVRTGETAEQAKQRIKVDSEDDLSIMLNLLDGPNAQKGQFFVFTTNQVDVFDTALLREGRMHVIELGRLDLASVRRYLYLFFPNTVLTDDQLKKLDAAVAARPPTLAELSQLLRTRDINKVLCGL